ncbi:hypothetical protein ACHAXR_005999 [Thalassiosira sp. AJA248-18]
MKNLTMQEDYPSLKKDARLTSREQFHVKLYAMLEMAALQGLGSSNTVSWLPHGRAFRILDQREFMEVVVPMFFKQTKIRSFYRQLNLWGFKRVSKGVDAGAWHNEFFLRGAPEEMDKMVRTKIKGCRPVQLGDQEEPDFYSMPPLPSAMASPVPGGLLRNGTEHRRVSMEGPAPPMGSFQFIGTQAPNYDERRSFPLPETTLSRCGSPLVSDISQLQGLPSTIRSRSDCQASMYAISSVQNVGKSSFGVGLEPLPSDLYSMPPLPRAMASPVSGGLLRNGAEHRRVSMEGPAPPMGSFQFIGTQAPNYDERRSFPLPETTLSRCGSPLVSDISQLQGLPSTIRSRSDCQASMYAISSVQNVGKSSFGVGLEPLPYYDGIYQAMSPAVIPSDNEAKRMVTARLEPLPFDEEVPFDEFANYIGNVIQTV